MEQPDSERDTMNKAAQALANAKHIVIFSGAGISAESTVLFLFFFFTFCF